MHIQCLNMNYITIYLFMREPYNAYNVVIKVNKRKKDIRDEDETKL